jgi:hypothetical protein
MRKTGMWLLGLTLVAAGGTQVTGAPLTDYWTWLWQQRARARAVSAQDAKTEFTEVIVKNKAGKQVAGISSDDFGNGLMAISEPTGEDPRAAMAVTPAGGGRVMVWNSAGVLTFGMDGDQGIGAFGADVAEAFAATSELPEGTVVVIDPTENGILTASTVAYDRRVAGVVAGTTAHRPAMTLNAGSGSDRKTTVTLTGTVYCLATNVNGPIRAGDLLTTSSVAGHAMRVTDHQAAQGAILGKAMQDLSGATGRILVLASLQ